MTPALHGRESATYPAGRICRFPSCAVPLSRYNPDPVCGVHVGQSTRKVKQVQKRRRDVVYVDGLKVCTRCGEAKPPDADYFYRDVANRDGLDAQCRICTLERRRERDRARALERERVS